MSLIEAVEEGNIRKVEAILDVNRTDKDGWTALLRASARGEIDEMKKLILLGANVFAMTNSGSSALSLAERRGDFPLGVELLKSHAASINDLGEALPADVALLSQALIIAAQKGKKYLVQLLLDHGANVDAKDKEDCTALMLAVGIHDRENVVLLLLQRGADVNAKDKVGRTALMKAALALSAESFATLQLLLDHGANVHAKDDDGCTALMFAVREAGRKNEVLLLLLERGADVNAKNKRGRTALMDALIMRRKDLIEPSFDRRFDETETLLLLQHGADVNAKDKDGHTALGIFMDRFVHTEQAVMLLDTEQAVMLRMLGPILRRLEALLLRGADVNAKDKVGRTALMKIAMSEFIFATTSGTFEALQLLLDHGAIVDVKDDDCNSALFHAMFRGRGDDSVFKLLLQHGATIDLDNDADEMFQASSRDLLSLAIERNDVSMVCLLLSHKAILHVTDTELNERLEAMSRTSLALAIQRTSKRIQPNEIRTLILLLKSGASLNVTIASVRTDLNERLRELKEENVELYDANLEGQGEFV